MIINPNVAQYSSCSLYGATSYTNAFLPINYLVILASFSLVALVYMVSRFLPPRMGGRVTAVTRVEMMELVISAVILLLVLAFSVTACSISSVISSSVTSGASASPIAYSETYIGTLTFNTGLTLLTNLYAYSISYSIASIMWNDLPDILTGRMPAPGVTIPTPPVQTAITFPFGLDLGRVYGIMSALMVDAFAPLVITALAMLFVQWISLPVIQATAFVLVLPVALAMRSFAYAAAGPGLRQAANAVLAIAIAAYIVYPLAVSFDPCIMGWLYGNQSCLSAGGISPGSNPLAQYLTPYTVSTLPPGLFSSTASSSYQSSIGPIPIPAVSSLYGTISTLGLPTIDPGVVISQMSTLVDSVSQFLFIGVFLFAIDVGITVAFAMGLTKALNSGIEAEARFWSS